MLFFFDFFFSHSLFDDDPLVGQRRQDALGERPALNFPRRDRAAIGDASSAAGEPPAPPSSPSASASASVASVLFFLDDSSSHSVVEADVLAHVGPRDADDPLQDNRPVLDDALRGPPHVAGAVLPAPAREVGDAERVEARELFPLVAAPQPQVRDAAEEALRPPVGGL